MAIASQPNHAVWSRSKHIDVRFHIIREAAANGLVRLEYIRTADMTADILTKALPRELHKRHVKRTWDGNCAKLIADFYW
jgi:hypothetical protein